MPGSRNAGQAEIRRIVLERHGRLFTEELGVDLGRNTPSPLFRWLCASLLLSARISSGIAMQAAAALAEAGWTTARKMAESTWEERVKVLNGAGYARYDESTSRMLGEAAARLIEDYKGDLRRLREAADRDPAEERKRLKAFKGIGDVGVDIFFREVQGAWDELYPFADKKALNAAKKLGLPDTAEGLAAGVKEADFPRLVSALVRADLAKDHEEILKRAGRQAAA